MRPRGETERLVEEECETITDVGLGLIGPSEESSYNSITIALPLQGSGVGDNWTAAGGTATLGLEKMGKGAAVAKARACWREVPTSLEIPRRRVRIPFSLAHFSSLKTIPTYKFKKKYKDKSCECAKVELANATLQESTPQSFEFLELKGNPETKGNRCSKQHRVIQNQN